MSKQTCDTCSVTWDRKMNLKDILLCPLHAAAPDLLAALEQLVQRCAEPPVTTGLEMTGNGGMIELLTREARALIAQAKETK